MPIKTSVALGALAALVIAGGAAATAAAQTAAPAAGPLILTVQPVALQFVSNTGPITGYPTAPLAPGDRILGQDRILQGGGPAGRDNESCTVSFNRDVLCQDIIILDGQGDVQASWTFRWPATGSRGPASFDGVIDGGTGSFGNAHGWFHAQALPDGDLQITATISADG
jgi:hypothetical protein